MPKMLPAGGETGRRRGKLWQKGNCGEAGEAETSWSVGGVGKALGGRVDRRSPLGEQRRGLGRTLEELAAVIGPLSS